MTLQEMAKRGCLFLSNEKCMKQIHRVLNLSVVNYQNPRKALEKIKPTLCYGHYVTDIILQTSHYRHYIMDIMTA